MPTAALNLSKYPVIVYEKPGALIRSVGDHALPSVSKLLIQTIKGNSDLLHARVTCIDDFHYCTFLKFVRADMLNSLIAAKRILDKPRKIIFMIEGTPFNATPSIEDYDDLVGEGLLLYPHFCTGWDSAKLHNEGLAAIQDFSELGVRAKNLEASLKSLQDKKHKFLHEGSIDLENWDEQLDALLATINSKQNEWDALSKKMTKLQDAITTISDKRNVCLQESIKRAAQQFPDADIYVIGGTKHFKGLSQAIPHISHAIIKLKRMIIIKDTFQALKEYFCVQPLLLLENFAIEPRLLQAPLRSKL